MGTADDFAPAVCHWEGELGRLAPVALRTRLTTRQDSVRPIFMGNAEHSSSTSRHHFFMEDGVIAQGIRIARHVCMAAAMALALGCAGKGEMVLVNVQPQPVVAPVPAGQPEPVKIVIEPFEDLRADKTKIGQRSHLIGGGVTFFNVSGGKPGITVAEALAERLRQKGWNGKGWDARVVQSGVGVSGADIVITGEVRDFSANGKARFMNTKIWAESRLVITAKNIADGSTTTRNIQGEQTQTVFWFDSDDIRDLLSATLKDGLDRFLTDTKIEDRALKSAK